MKILALSISPHVTQRLSTSAANLLVNRLDKIGRRYHVWGAHWKQNFPKTLLKNMVVSCGTWDRRSVYIFFSGLWPLSSYLVGYCIFL